MLRLESLASAVARGPTGGGRSLAVLTVLLGAVLLVAGTAAVGGAPPPDGYALVQGDSCTTLSPVSGSQAVEDAYDYRNPYPERTGNPAAGTYSAHGFDRFQDARTSTLFVYRGPRGDSLVLLHGERGGEGPGGSTATFEFAGLPAGGSWAVQDDDYPNRDDDWSVGRTGTTVSWFWSPNRTDGGAYRGLAGATGPIVVQPRFNERAPGWGRWQHSGAPEHRVRTWRAVTAGGGALGLNTSAPVLLAPGSCASVSPPRPTVEATPGTLPRDRPVTLTARAGAWTSVGSYRWDFDGDGAVDRVTDGPRTQYRFREAGRQSVSVVVETAAGTSRSGSVSVRVGLSDQPAISVTGVEATAAVAGEPTPVAVGLVNDGGGAGTLRLDVVADGETVGSRSVEVDALSNATRTVNTTFPEAGEYTVTVGAARTEVQVAEAAPELSVERVDVDGAVREGESVTVRAAVQNVGNVEHEFPVRLTLFGEVVDSERVTLAPEERRTVEFEVTVSAAGTYTARVGDRRADVVVRPADGTVTETDSGSDPDSEGGLPGFGPLAGALALVLGLALSSALARRR